MFKVVALLIFLITVDALAPYDDQHGSHSHERDYYTEPHYSFVYEVNDPHTHDIKGQKEDRQGEHTQGLYYLLEPDGSKRTVEYFVEGKSGFNAVVHRSNSKHTTSSVYGVGSGSGYGSGGSGGHIGGLSSVGQAGGLGIGHVGLLHYGAGGRGKLGGYNSKLSKFGGNLGGLSTGLADGLQGGYGDGGLGGYGGKVYGPSSVSYVSHGGSLQTGQASKGSLGYGSTSGPGNNGASHEALYVQYGGAGNLLQVHGGHGGALRGHVGYGGALRNFGKGYGGHAVSQSSYLLKKGDYGGNGGKQGGYSGLGDGALGEYAGHNGHASHAGLLYDNQKGALSYGHSGLYNGYGTPGVALHVNGGHGGNLGSARLGVQGVHDGSLGGSYGALYVQHGGAGNRLQSQGGFNLGGYGVHDGVLGSYGGGSSLGRYAGYGGSLGGYNGQAGSLRGLGVHGGSGSRLGGYGGNGGYSGVYGGTHQGGKVGSNGVGNGDAVSTVQVDDTHGAHIHTTIHHVIPKHHF